MKTKVILAIETSCDDTSIAILKNQKVLSNVTLSTIDKHCKYGGIVPEIAARGHEQCLSKCFTQALVKAKIKREQLTHIAYAAEPGLPGSIHVGKVFAKSMAFLLDIPLIPINHMMGHVFSFAINKDKKDIRFPFISLVASGGHTSIYLFKSFTNYKLLTKTNDDAIGETLDKIGRMLNLKYPGGISIDQIYCQNKSNVKLINHFQPNAPFSFSGMKTHILNLINQYKMKKNKIDKVSIASSLLK
jgi:N6-L-threonylcarbamoyladenine synthase